MIVLPPLAPAQTNYMFYNCYMRAAFEGIQLQNCPISAQNASDGNCETCV